MDKDLPIRAAKLFSQKPWKHGEGVNLDSNDGYNYCPKCGKAVYYVDWESTGPTPEAKKPCSIPDPFDITDLGKALGCFRGLGLPTLLLLSIEGVFDLYPYEVPALGNKSDCFKTWLVYEATAEQIWEICCLAKEAEK